MLTVVDARLTTGDSPVTVTVSLSVLTLSETFSSTTAPTPTGMAVAPQRAEALECVFDAVIARRQRRKPVRAHFAGDDGRRSGHAGASNRDGYAGQDRARFVRDGADDLAGGSLRECWCGNCDQQKQPQALCEDASPHVVPPRKSDPGSPADQIMNSVGNDKNIRRVRRRSMNWSDSTAVDKTCQSLSRTKTDALLLTADFSHNVSR